MIVGFTVVKVFILSQSMWRFTVSKAFDMSRETNTVLLGGRFWLKPFAMAVVIELRAVTVEWFGLKPCWKSLFGIPEVM